MKKNVIKNPNSQYKRKRCKHKYKSHYGFPYPLNEKYVLQKCKKCGKTRIKERN